jgi:trehalose/maltose hydrolase-like predicted phosphorylase
MASAMEADIPTFRPRLPRHWRRLALPIVWKGRRLHVDITPGRSTVTHRGGDDIEVCVNGQVRALPAGTTQTWPAPDQGKP